LTNKGSDCDLFLGYLMTLSQLKWLDTLQWTRKMDNEYD